MKKLLLTLSVLFILSCAKNESGQTSSTSSDSLASDSTAAIPNPAPQSDTAASSATYGSNPNNMSDSATSSTNRRDSAR